MEKELLQSLHQLVAIFCQATGKSQKYVAWRALKNNKFWDQLEGGSGFQIRTYDRLLQWLSNRWPEGAHWPEGALRPDPQPVHEDSVEEVQEGCAT